MEKPKVGQIVWVRSVWKDDHVPFAIHTVGRKWAKMGSKMRFDWTRDSWTVDHPQRSKREVLTEKPKDSTNGHV